MLGRRGRRAKAAKQAASGDRDAAPSFSASRDQDDAALADAIDADGMARLAAGDAVPLARYLDAIPGLRSKPEALDAAINIALLSIKRSTPRPTQAAEMLARQHPDLASAIREAASIDQAIISTPGIVGALQSAETRVLPAEFGPIIAPGRTRYLLLRRLGSGSFGRVYLANDRLLGTDEFPALVAVKILNLTTTDPAVRSRAIDEANRARRVAHPNVVRVVDRGDTAEGEDYIVFDYIPAGTAAMLLEEYGGRLPARTTAAFMAKVARGVQAAHAAGLVHCDLKPSNILLNADGEPLVADFGVAADLADEAADIPAPTASGSGSGLGNLAFISPEQFRKEPGALAPATDIYALGGLLYYFLTGLLPNGSTTSQIEQTHNAQRGRIAAPRLANRSAGIDRDLEAICRRALAPSPADRYGSAGELAADLEAWCGSVPIHWTRPTPWRQAVLLTRRQPKLVALGAAMVVGLLAAAVLVGYYSSVANQRAAELLRRHDAAMKIHLELPGVITLETKFAKGFLSPSSADKAFRNLRIQSLADTVRLQSQYMDLFDVQNSVQQAKLLVWYIVDEQADQAAKLLTDMRAVWERLIPPESEWILDLTAFEDHLAADRILAEALAEPVTPALLARAEAVRKRLVVHETRLEKSSPGSGVHSAVLTALVQLDLPGVLNNPDELRHHFETFDRCGAMLLHPYLRTPPPR